MYKYQQRHNIIRKDFELLLEITEESKNSPDKFNALFRACVKGILSLIESDMFGLNQIDEYKNYKDNDCFEVKFKNTFKQICETWNKPDIIKKYLDTKYGGLKIIKKKRDKMIHPKKSEDILNATEFEFEILKSTFYDYTKMLHSLMNNFHMVMEFKDQNEFIEFMKD